MCRCEGVTMFRYEGVTVCRCEGVTICRCNSNFVMARVISSRALPTDSTRVAEFAAREPHPPPYILTDLECFTEGSVLVQ